MNDDLARQLIEALKQQVRATERAAESIGRIESSIRVIEEILKRKPAEQARAK